MDKNGQNRGGARPGAGRKPKSKVTIEFDSKIKIKPDDIPKMPEVMGKPQKDHRTFDAGIIYTEITAWLKKRQLDEHAPEHLIQIYAVNVARWMQAEDILSEQGLWTMNAKDVMIENPMVNVSMNYQKQASAIWYQINSMINNGTGGEVNAEEPTTDLIELLRQRKAK